MKAVLAAVGSVLPGLGNIGGFLAGGALDIIYGKDIQKFIDKVADEFDDNKVYVFNCPLCGNSWAKKEDEKPVHVNIFDSSSNSSESVEGVFNEEFSAFVDEMGSAVQDAISTEQLSMRMIAFGEAYEETDEIEGSQFFFLAGLCNLLYAREHQGKENTQTELERAFKYLEKANRLCQDSEYELMLEAVRNLQCTVPERCVDLGTLETYKFESPTLFKEEWLISIYEYCRFDAIVRAVDQITVRAYDQIFDDIEEFDSEVIVELWNSGSELRDKDYSMVCCIYAYLWGEDELKTSGLLNKAFETEGYDIDTCDVDNFYDQRWLNAYVHYACSIVKGTNAYRSQDTAKGLEMLMKAAALKDCPAKTVACYSLGIYYEEGTHVAQNLYTALQFFSADPNRHEEDIQRVKSKIANRAYKAVWDRMDPTAPK
ncbi:MAG: SEL1-like repeat protein [Bacteroidales bacterium]|nr:SEL1-like repeat protein [Bacteroidales bacterium]